MKKISLVVFIAVALIAFCGVSFAGNPDNAGKQKFEQVEKTGVIEVQKAGPNDKFDTVLLKVGNETFKLIPAKSMKKEFPNLEKLAGKEVTVKGGLMPANDKFPMAAISVESFAEKTAGAAPAVVQPDNKSEAPVPVPASAPTPAPAPTPDGK